MLFLLEWVLHCVIIRIFRVKLTSYGEVLEDKLVNQELEAGLLLEFKKDAERVLLAVVHRRDGKKNWMVFDQVSILVLIYML